VPTPNVTLKTSIAPSIALAALSVLITCAAGFFLYAFLVLSRWAKVFGQLIGGSLSPARGRGGARPGATRGLKRFPDYTKSRTPSKLTVSAILYSRRRSFKSPAQNRNDTTDTTQPHARHSRHHLTPSPPVQSPWRFSHRRCSRARSGWHSLAADRIRAATR
jgi:hypothetical protein